MTLFPYTTLFRSQEWKRRGNTRDNNSPMKEDNSNKARVGHATRSNFVSFFFFVNDHEVTPVKASVYLSLCNNHQFSRIFYPISPWTNLNFKCCLNLGLILASILLNLALSSFLYAMEYKANLRNYKISIVAYQNPYQWIKQYMSILAWYW